MLQAKGAALASRSTHTILWDIAAEDDELFSVDIFEKLKLLQRGKVAAGLADSGQGRGSVVRRELQQRCRGGDGRAARGTSCGLRYRDVSVDHAGVREQRSGIPVCFRPELS
ncbi:hypothetical protein NL108_000734 [Boleophthalmus pectinirostris]|nr:hypothetical protein NL108_000734 [Boleophthalmus pectinirostris]